MKKAPDWRTSGILSCHSGSENSYVRLCEIPSYRYAALRVLSQKQRAKQRDRDEAVHMT
jgi:hypothetical protein